MRRIRKDIASCLQEKERLVEKLVKLAFRLPDLAAIIYCEENQHIPPDELSPSSDYGSELLEDYFNFDKEFIMDCGKALKRYIERIEYFEEMEQHYGCNALEYHFECEIEDK